MHWLVKSRANSAVFSPFGTLLQKVFSERQPCMFLTRHQSFPPENVQTAAVVRSGSQSMPEKRRRLNVRFGQKYIMVKTGSSER